MFFDAENLTLIVLGLLLLLTGGTLVARRRAGRRDPYPFEALPLFDAQIKALLPQLRQVVTGRYLLCLAVPLAQLLRPRPALAGKLLRQQQEALLAHEVDVLLCDEESLQPVAALLIDRAEDKSGFRAQALLAAGIPPVRLRRSPAESPEQLRALIEEGLGVHLSAGDNAQQSDWVLGSLNSVEDGSAGWSLGSAVGESSPVQSGHPSREQDRPPCPECGSPQTLRRASRGRHQGQEFLVCSRFPECQQVRPVNRR